MTGRWLAGVPLLLSLRIVDPSAVQEMEFGLTIDFDALHYDNPDPMADNPPEGLSPGWDQHPRVDWSRPAGENPGNWTRSCSTAARLDAPTGLETI